MPYDPRASITEQVHASLQSSFRNLRPEDDEASSKATIIDSLYLHSPLPTMTDTLEAWAAFETYVPYRVRALGISNVIDLSILQQLDQVVKVKPSVVQNRFYKATHYDDKIRAFGLEKSMIYQSFWTLSAADPKFIREGPVARLAEKADISPAAAYYCMVLSLDRLVILNGTTDPSHMKADLAAVVKVKTWAEKNHEEWEELASAWRKKVNA